MPAKTLAPIVAQPIAGANIWWPLFLSPGILTVGLLLLFFKAETLHVCNLSRNSNHGSELQPSNEAGDVKELQTNRQSLVKTLKLFNNRSILLLTPSSAFSIPMVTAALGIMAQYISVKYQWSLTEVGAVVGARTGFSILVILGGLPLVAHMLRRRDARVRDLHMAQVSAAFLVVGLAAVVASPNVGGAIAGLMILTLGSRIPMLCRAVLSDRIPKGHVGRLFATLAMLETAGYTIFTLGLGALFQAGLRLSLGDDGKPDGQNVVLGLPFFCATAISLVFSIALWMVELPQ